MQRQQLIIDGKRTAYWQNNATKLPAVVLLHGLGGDHRGLLPLASFLSNYHVIIPDLPGYGESDPLQQPHNLNNYALFLEALRKQLHLQHFYLVGHSFGGAIAITYANKFPDHIIKLCLFNPVIVRPQGFSMHLGFALSRLAFHLPTALKKLLLISKPSVYLTDSTIIRTKNQAIRQQILSQDYDNYRKLSLRAMQDSLSVYSPHNNSLPDTINVPALIVMGTKDPLVNMHSIETLKQDQPMHLKQVDGGHLFPLEEAKLASQFMQNWFHSS